MYEAIMMKKVVQKWNLNRHDKLRGVPTTKQGTGTKIGLQDANCAVWAPLHDHFPQECSPIYLRSDYLAKVKQKTMNERERTNR